MIPVFFLLPLDLPELAWPPFAGRDSSSASSLRFRAVGKDTCLESSTSNLRANFDSEITQSDFLEGWRKFKPPSDKLNMFLYQPVWCITTTGEKIMLQQSLMNFESGTTQEQPRALEGHFLSILNENRINNDYCGSRYTENAFA